MNRKANIVKRVFNMLGLKISRMSVDLIDLRSDHRPLKTLLTTAELRPVLLDLKLQNCRFGVLPIIEQPWYLALKAGGNSSDAIRRWLYEYYRTLEPASSAEYMGLTNEQCPALADESIRCQYYPWEQKGLKKTKDDLLNYSYNESVAAGRPYRSSTLKVTDSWNRIQSDQHAQRMLKLQASMRRNGYKRDHRNDGDTGGVVMLGDNNVLRWMSTKGHHRKIVALALGITQVPVRVTGLVRRCDAECWPGVVSGEYDVVVARELFDKVVAGHKPECHTVAVTRADAALRCA